MGLVSAATLGCAGFCTWLGFWPVLPFAGLELVAVAWALIVSMRRNRYREVVTFGLEQVRVEFGTTGRGPSTQIELPRGWVRVRIERNLAVRHAPTRLELSSSGHRVRIGRCLTDEERDQLAKRFTSLLHVETPTQGLDRPAQVITGEG